MTGMKPKDAIELKEVPLVNQENYPPEDTLPEDGLYPYLLEPREEHDNLGKRAKDRTWSKKTHSLSEVTSSPGNWVMHHPHDGL